MRWCLLLVCGFTFTLSANSLAQQEKVSFDLKEVTVKVLLDEIQKQTNLCFLFNPEQTAPLGKMSLKVNNEAVTDVLDRIFQGTALTYKFRNDLIVIMKRGTGTDDKDKKSVIKIVGQVTDESKYPLPGVTVRVKNLGTLGAATDKDGKYKLNVPSVKEFVLVFSFVGMKEQEVKYAGKDTINVVMKEDMNQMDEVTVVSTGYQDIDRRKLTSSVTSLKMDDIRIAGFSTVDQMLEGRVPGMIFMQNSGQVGAAPKVRIRGTSTVLGNQEPLWVVDGIVQSDPVNIDPSQLNDLDFVNLLGNAISGLNPDDIEQVDVLKDAAATAIYGTRAANGVIVITTKRGKAGALSVTYSLSGTFNRRPYYKDREVYVMNSKERVDASRELFERQVSFEDVSVWTGYEKSVLDYKAGRLSFADYQKQVDYYETVNTDWFDILCKNSFSNKHTLSITGGSDEIRYYASFGFNDQKGVIRKEGEKQITTALKLNGNFKRVTFQFGMQFNSSNRKYTPSVANMSVVQYAYETSRTMPAYNPDGSFWFYDRQVATTAAHPFSMLNEMDETWRHVDNHSVTMTGNVKLKVLNSLNVEGVGSYSMGNTNEEIVYTEDSYYVADLREDNYGVGTCPLGGEWQNKNTRQKSYTLRLQLNYSQGFGELGQHAVNAALGGEVSSKKYNNVDEIQRGYYPDRGKTFGNVSEALKTDFRYDDYWKWLAANKPKLTESQTNLASAYFSATYGYDNRYTFNFNTRIDGSNQFGSRSKEKLLPIWSVSGRWNIAEDFWPGNPNVNMLALKLSYGKQGNIIDNQTSKMTIQKDAYDDYFDDFTSTVKYFPNPDLKWETTSSYNAELTFSLLKDKIGGTVGYYYKKTSDAFLNKTVSEINGTQNYVVNKGVLSNQGVEVTLNFTPINRSVDAQGKQGFVWRFDPQLGQMLNKVINKVINNQNNVLRDKISYTDFLNGNVEVAGKPLNTFFSYRFKGLSPENGMPIFHGMEAEREEELHERYKTMSDEDICMEVMESSGTLVPVLQGGISNYFGYRRFNLSFNLTYSLGNKIRLMNNRKESRKNQV